jgi:subtilisin
MNRKSNVCSSAKQFPAARALGSLALLALLTALFSLVAGGPSTSSAPAGPKSYIVMLDKSVASPAEVARSQAAAHGMQVDYVYTAAIKGYAARMMPAAAEAIARDPLVAYVQPDQPLTDFGEPRTQIQRTFATKNSNIDIDGVDDARIDANVAVLDDWVLDRSELNIVAKTDCMHSDVELDPEDPLWHPNERLNGEGESLPYGCLDYSEDPPNLTGSHGTGVADRIAGIDGFDSVGVAPGARLWGVVTRPPKPPMEPLTPIPPMMEPLIAAVDWVTATRLDADPSNDIEVANMSLGCKEQWKGDPEEDPYAGFEESGNCDHTILDAALSASADLGVVYVAAAGNKPFQFINQPIDTSFVTPANSPDVITVSNMSDFDGLAGGLAETKKDCGPPDPEDPEEALEVESADDTLDTDSMSGLGVEIAAPTPCGGTSGATAEVSGAAAILASQCKPESREDVRFIADTLIAEGNLDWVDNSGDGRKEPLLDLSNGKVFDPVMVGEEAPTGGCEWRSHQAESDVDGDGRSDLVSMNGDANVFAGTLEGFDTGSPAISLEGQLDPALVDEDGYYAVDVADVTGDRRADLVTAKDGDGVYVYPGKADGTFGSGAHSFPGASTVFNGAGPNEPIAAADVDGDGLSDMITYREDLHTIFVSPGREDGTFGPVGEGTVGSLKEKLNSALLDAKGDYFLDVIDVTGDGLADLVTSNTNGSLYVYPGQKTRAFSSTPATTALNPIMDDGEGEEPVGLGDFNRDRRADLLVLDGETLKLHMGQANGSFAEATEPYEGKVDSSLMDGEGEELVGLLDYSRDGLSDLISVTDEGELLTYTAQRDLTFAAPVAQEGSFTTISTSPSGHEFVAEKPSWWWRREWRSHQAESDVDGDGHSDLVTMHPDGLVDVYPGSAEGTFGGGVASFSDGEGAGTLDPAQYDGEGHYVVDVADVTGNRRSDLVTVSDDGDVHVHGGEADGSFSEEGSVTELEMTPALLKAGGDEPIAAADVTGDGHADLVSYDDESDHLTVYPGTAAGIFEAGETTEETVYSALHTGSGEYFLDAADLTGDGRADLVSMTTWKDLYTRAGKADGTFADPVSSQWGSVDPALDDGSGREPVGLGDVTGDGKADLVLTQSGSVYVYLAQSGADLGRFGAPKALYGGALPSTTFGASSGYEFVGVLDVSGNGRADILAAHTNGRVYVAGGQEDGSFEAVPSVSFEKGFLKSTQHFQNQISGSELVSEKPALRRRGCASNGCHHTTASASLVSGFGSTGRGGGYSIYPSEADGDVLQRWWNAEAGWSEWGWHGSPPGGQATSESAATSTTGADHVFVRGANGALWQKSWSDEAGKWSEWTSLGGELASGTGPAAVSREANKIDVFARAAADKSVIRRSWSSGSGWGAWETVSGTTGTTGLGALGGSGGIDLYMRDSSGDVVQRWWTASTGWSEQGWHGSPPGGPTTSAPAAISLSGSVHVFVRGADRALWEKTWNGEKWSEWTSLGGVLRSGPSVTSPAAGQIHVFARFANDSYWRKRWSGEEGWSRWEPVF